VARKMQTGSGWMPVYVHPGAQRFSAGGTNAMLAAPRPHVLVGNRLLAASGSGCRFLSPREVEERRDRERRHREDDCR